MATIRYAEVVDGDVVDQHLCKECLDQKQNSVRGGFEFTKPAPFNRGHKDSEVGTTSLHRTLGCSSCNTNLQSVLASKQVGCSQCYDSFTIQIDKILEGMHDSLTHTGKIPRQDNLRAKARADLQTKRSLLKTSLTAERYEEAAILRDEIKKLEAGLDTSLKGSEMP